MIRLLMQEAPPAGGGSVSEIVSAAAVASVALLAVIALGVAHRRNGFLSPLVRQVEARTGLPAWAAIPVAIAGVSLIIAVWGYYWDVSWHIDKGRDDGAFANPAHWFIIIGLDGIAFAGMLAFFLGDGRSPSSVRLTDRWSVPVGAVLLGACGVIALAGFPLDDIWHRLFGQDVTAWGPTHIQMIGGASLSTLGCWVLMIEGRRAVGDRLTAAGRRMAVSSDVMLGGAFLVGLSTLQVEFDYGVPQFRQLEHPVLIAIGAGIALVAARIRIGRGGALGAVAMFLVIRGGLALGVAAFGRIDMHFPLYIAAALIVEAVALAIPPRERQVTFGAAAGLVIGTVGFAAEWAWSRAWMPLGWTGDMLPDAIIVVAVAGTAAGTLGGLVGRALMADGARQPTPRAAAILGWAGVVAAIGFALPMTAHTDWSADLRLEPADAGLAYVSVQLDPADAAEGAAWFNVLSWQGADEGEDGGTSTTELIRQPDGSYRTAEPVPISGKAKTMLRLHTGRSMQVVPIYLPEDDAIPAASVPAEDGVRTFQADKKVLQREARTDNVNLERAAYVLLALVAAGWMAVIAWGLVRLERPPRVLSADVDEDRPQLPTEPRVLV